jgi:twitching motility protein PilT
MNASTESQASSLGRIVSLLQQAAQAEASDVHPIPGHIPVCRIHGEIRELAPPILEEQAVLELVAACCPASIAGKLRENKSIDFSMEIPLGNEIPERKQRFRCNVFTAEEQIAACLRLVPDTIPRFEWAEFPLVLAQRIANLRDGLVVVTGITGSGKTTTLAMIVNLINARGGSRIITVEEPIEYRFPKAGNSVVTQREVGPDVNSFSDGLRSGLRQDPDVILVGEIRDRETAQMAISAAETGHLVLTTLHTRDAKGAISRMADLFPQDVQGEIRSQLAMSLRTIISQRLLPDVDPGQKRHLALEILWNSAPIAVAIRQGKLESIDNYLLTRRDEGMQGFDEAVRSLWHAGKIDRLVAEHNVSDPASLNW